MGVIAKIKDRRIERIREKIIRYGFILLGLNLALIIGLFFSLMGTSSLMSLLQLKDLMLFFLPLVVIFLFSGFCSIIWYRFGQIIGNDFKTKSIATSNLIAAISIFPLLFLMVFLSLLLGVFPLSSYFVSVFVGTVFITTLAVIFEIPVLTLGVLTR